MKNTALGFLCGIVLTSGLYTYNGEQSNLSASLIYDPSLEASIEQTEALVAQYEVLEKATEELVAIEAKEKRKAKKAQAEKEAKKKAKKKSRK